MATMETQTPTYAFRSATSPHCTMPTTRLATARLSALWGLSESMPLPPTQYPLVSWNVPRDSPETQIECAFLIAGQVCMATRLPEDVMQILSTVPSVTSPTQSLICAFCLLTAKQSRSSTTSPRTPLKLALKFVMRRTMETPKTGSATQSAMRHSSDRTRLGYALLIVQHTVLMPRLRTISAWPDARTLP